MIEHVDEERMNYVCNKILENKAIQASNSQIWTAFLDDQLREFVVQYNFNFFEVANRFHDFIAFPYKYDFSEDEIRRHWSFLHACRYLEIEIDDEYYDKLKARAKEEEKENENIKKEESLDLEKEKKEMEKYKAARFNLIDISEADKSDVIINPEDNNFDYDNPIENKLKNDELFEKSIENIDFRKEENNIKENLNNLKNQNECNNTKNIEEYETEVDTRMESFENNKKEQNFTNNKQDKPFENSHFEKTINENNLNLKNNEKKIESLNGFEDDDIINALFKVSQKISVEEEFPKNLTIDGKDYSLPDQSKEKEEELFPINTKIIPEHNLSEEELIKYREKMLKEYKKGGIDPEIDNTKSFDDLIKEDKKLKTQYDNLNTYFNFAVKSLNYFVPKMSKNLKGNNNTLNNQNDLVGSGDVEGIIKKILNFKLNN